MIVKTVRGNLFRSAVLWMALLVGFGIHGEDSLLDQDFSSLSLEELLQIKVSSASGIEETLRDAPAVMVVITQNDIQRRGYTDLVEVIGDLPGFDVSISQGTAFATAYQRGYRTPFTQRVLFLINGVVTNMLWSHNFVISRQYPLSNVDRIEVLYGPAGAVYGPNAFSGVVNLITKNPSEFGSESHFAASLQVGSFESAGVDLTAGGSIGDLRYAISGRIFASDEADLDDMPGTTFIRPELLSDRDLWGPVLAQNFRDVSYGEYANRSDNWGIVAEFVYKNLTAGITSWETDEGYGVYYAFDRTQPNQGWINGGTQLYFKHEGLLAGKVKVKNEVTLREDGISGGWVEATPDWRAGAEQYSFVSISDWNSENSAWKLRQDYDWQVNPKLRLTGGIKYERKELTKAYDICQYWAGSLCTSASNDLDPAALDAHLGSLGNFDGSLTASSLGAGIYHTTVADGDFPPLTLTSGTVPTDNLAETTDKGVYLQAIGQVQQWHVQAALRWDENSLYGSFVKPRVSVVRPIGKNYTVKFLYGEAFQEPPPIQLWGGWTGRAANPNLQPEEIRNLEFVFLAQTRRMLHECSLYQAEYTDVIKEEAENAGDRTILGLEYRGRFKFDHFRVGLDSISGYVYYSYTDAESSIHYDHDQGLWLEGDTDLGDIAPHKINLGLDVPLGERLHAFLRTNWVSDRKLYSRNPLRAQDEDLDGYTRVDAFVSYRWHQVSLGLKANNLFDETHFHPGTESAAAGDDGSQRSLAFHSSVLPQVGRNWQLQLNFNW
ncbi:TonB-dependent receptor plug domain-containing protein [Sulfidibacter corallicola]|uniref:TonB-dependent receptor plug domain-containing protein n=1 Tax=Sulfidibacter corallicola TaxID=2818388 RepID=A0A8A4TNL4_SULCO|nr:TonB-dependent receptor plug domain-containing protein [Sulfidibacter corallicola]QTD51017.1 TonB-dependent receptor plug domain-containing protein [Sulfidibacter corallicola]